MASSVFAKLFGWMLPSPKNIEQHHKDMDPRDVPAQYWPETQHFIENLKQIVDENTIDDPQAKRMNTEILRYVEKQIEKKAYSGTYEDKCQALEMIADRVLTGSVNKLVGQKQQTSETTLFSNCINQFKSDIEAKRQSFITLHE